MPNNASCLSTNYSQYPTHTLKCNMFTHTMSCIICPTVFWWACGCGAVCVCVHVLFPGGCECVLPGNSSYSSKHSTYVYIYCFIHKHQSRVLVELHGNCVATTRAAASMNGSIGQINHKASLEKKATKHDTTRTKPAMKWSTTHTSTLSNARSSYE